MAVYNVAFVFALCCVVTQAQGQTFSQTMVVYNVAFVFALCCVVTQAQRPFYAGMRPIGFPVSKTNVFSNRFGEDAGLPIEAKGDGNLIQRLNSLPADRQPFWYLNWRHYDALRKNPQTYPTRPNVFANSK
ncbi:unnamed protein product [Euphydryas editha]|uniref:Uncharacterized protein n=1 Tax=Euphydryas editha TaxID=104508 RepID=A0AAU9U0F2_EUPED|nr:unnamed protein product [Euphydryas editha]